jgi:NAD(P)H-quinone oxidoreductase subunit I
MGAVSSYFANIRDAVVTTLEGLKITSRHLWTQPPITIQYPDVDVEATLPERYRGFLVNEVELCTGCALCAKACPIKIIYIDVERDEATKERLIKRYDIDLGKCMYCGLCLEPCPTGSIHFTPRFEAATTNLSSLYHQFVERGAQAIYKNPKAPGGAADAEE